MIAQQVCPRRLSFSIAICAIGIALPTDRICQMLGVVYLVMWCWQMANYLISSSKKYLPTIDKAHAVRNDSTEDGDDGELVNRMHCCL